LPIPKCPQQSLWCPAQMKYFYHHLKLRFCYKEREREISIEVRLINLKNFKKKRKSSVKEISTKGKIIFLIKNILNERM
jgi:hypothetical protein